MGKEGDTVVAQVSFGGFDRSVTAEELTDFLEDEVGLVWRCRLKTSWTPPDSYPNFKITNTENTGKNLDYQKVEPHAFVHFAMAESANSAVDAAGRSRLILKNQPLKVSLGPENPFSVNQRRRTTMPYRFSNVLVEIGTLASHDDFIVAWRGPPSGVDFLVDPFDGGCKICFSRDTAFSFKGTRSHVVIKCDFKVEFAVRDINEMQQYRNLSGFVVLLHLASAPRVWYRTADDDIYDTVPFEVFDDDDPWIRTTDFTHSGAVGRCNFYRISVSPRYEGKLRDALDYLKRRRVHEGHFRQLPSVKDEPDYGTPIADPFFCLHNKQGIAFEVMYLVNVVMHKGIFNQYQLTESFFDILRGQSNEVNAAALKHLSTYKCPLFDASRRMKLVQEWILKNPKLLKSSIKQLDDIVEIRRVVITPTRALCLPPEVELSNRVLRHYKYVSDRFLRVTFMDEGMQTMNPNVLTYYAAPILRMVTTSFFSQKTHIFKRVKDILTDGFYLCGRKYSFLAFSSNQLRDHSAWFFAEDKKTSISDITRWMGKFNNKNVAKCAARMGQCFSSTYATVEVPAYEVNSELEDIKRNGYIFSDGIGTITPDLAEEVKEKLKLDTSLPPCAYQIRYAGCKGVVACWPSKGGGTRLAIRPSMTKFQSDHATLEICSWTRFQPGFLNRQIITLLSTLKVPDEVFWKMQESMIFKLSQMLEDTDVAFEVLTASCADQGNTAAIMISAGFMPKTEPHLRGMLTSIKAAQLWALREKSRIFVPCGRWLMGCLDEIGELEQGQCFIQVSTPSLENCFSKHGSRFNEMNNLQVIKGYVVIAKNPCLHPGDIRILEAVDAPGLHHLYDCLVFPQKGERPHANEASGSDLDGDLYFVTWDENLIPPSKRSSNPMQYEPAEAIPLSRPVNHQDLIEFFVRHMVKESLGAICNAHVVHADHSEDGALDDNCKLLAELAAMAVDFPKTGKLVTMPPHLKPKLYPDFMGKEDYQSYKSNKILGRLYRRVKDAYDSDVSASSELNMSPDDIPYDYALEISGSEDFIPDAWDLKRSYDSQLIGLLGQYKVKREEEIVTGHVWSMPKYTSRKQGELKERLKHAYSSLKKEFRQAFERMDQDFDKLSDEEKNALYERKASAWYQVTYHSKFVKLNLDLHEPEGPETVLMLSFPWIAADYLAQIKIKARGTCDVEPTKPINSLVRYLMD